MTAPKQAEFGKFKKGDIQRTAYSPAERVQFQFDGWTPTDKKAKQDPVTAPETAPKK